LQGSELNDHHWQISGPRSLLASATSYRIVIDQINSRNEQQIVELEALGAALAVPGIVIRLGGKLARKSLAVLASKPAAHPWPDGA
jgi:hypothetical protein